MSNIVLKDRQGIKQTYSGVEVIKIADSEGNYNNYVAEPTGEIEITANGSVDVSKYARARVAVPSDTADEWDGTGVVIAPIEPEQPMTFTINGTSYQMDNRMTWYAWTRSEYNTDGFSCANENDYVYEAESTNKVTDADGNDVLGTTYIVEGGAYLIKEEATTDELQGTWVFNDGSGLSVLSQYSDPFSVSFNSDGKSYSAMYCDADKSGEGMWALRYQRSDSSVANEVYIFGLGWNEQVYRTITITSEPTDTTFIAWLKANATKQGAISLITFTIDGTTFQAESGMTWAEWVASDYNTNGFKIDSVGNVVSSTGLKVATAQYSGNQYSTDTIVAYTSYVVQHAGGAD